MNKWTEMTHCLWGMIRDDVLNYVCDNMKYDAIWMVDIQLFNKVMDQTGDRIGITIDNKITLDYINGQ